MVVYQTDVKHEWLHIDRSILDDPKLGPVSQQATEQLARNILLVTPQANLSGAITGHLGPSAPVDLDGAVYLSLAKRMEWPTGDVNTGVVTVVTVANRALVLQTPRPQDDRDLQSRYNRQMESARSLIEFLLQAILLLDS
jgi:nicotinamide-nucleotide amidase